MKESKKVRKLPVVTLYLCIFMIIVFIFDTFIFVPKNIKLLSQEHFVNGDKTGALTNYFKLVTLKVLSGQVWRPLTSMFLHAGIIHIVLNLITFINIGVIVERIIGSKRFFIAFLGSGFISAILMMMLTGIEDGLGASTAICGIFGVLIIWLFYDRKTVLEKMHWFNWLILAVMLVLDYSIDNITRLEHFTGTVGGILIGVIFIYRLKEKTKDSINRV